MKHIIEFESGLFNSSDIKPHFINDRCFGEDLVSWLIKKFPDSPFVFDDPFQEDWGWATLARRDGETFLVGVGIMDESIGKTPAEWMVIVDKMRRFVIFGSKKSPNLDVLADQIESALRQNEGILNVRRSVEN